jgi:hypothetical protein
MTSASRERRLSDYRAIGYEQASLAPGYDRPANEPVVEWIEGASPPFDDLP